MFGYSPPEQVKKYAGSAIGVGAVALVGAPLVLAGLGFGTGGVAAGSTAAAWQSSIGNVAAGSIFASLQSAGVVGFTATGNAIIAGSGAAVGALGTGCYDLSKNLWNKAREAGLTGSAKAVVVGSGAVFGTLGAGCYDLSKNLWNRAREAGLTGSATAVVVGSGTAVGALGTGCYEGIWSAVSWCSKAENC